MADPSSPVGSRLRPSPPQSSTPTLNPRIPQPQFSAPLPGAVTTPPGSPGRLGTYTVNTDLPPSMSSLKRKRRDGSGKKTKKRKSRKSRKSRKPRKSKKIKNKKSKRRTKRR